MQMDYGGCSIWLLLCFFFFTVGPSDWIALLFYYMTKRNNTIAAEAALWTMAKARTIIGFICIHLICSHAISYCLLDFIITPRKSNKGNHFIPFFKEFPRGVSVQRISMKNDVINVLTERLAQQIITTKISGSPWGKLYF